MIILEKVRQFGFGPRSLMEMSRESGFASWDYKFLISGWAWKIFGEGYWQGSELLCFLPTSLFCNWITELYAWKHFCIALIITKMLEVNLSIVVLKKSYLMTAGEEILIMAAVEGKEKVRSEF